MMNRLIQSVSRNNATLLSNNFRKQGNKQSVHFSKWLLSCSTSYSSPSSSSSSLLSSSPSSNLPSATSSSSSLSFFLMSPKNNTATTSLITNQKRGYARPDQRSFEPSFFEETANPHTAYTVATVFGATGFIGKYVVHELAQAGYQVVVPYRNSEFSVSDHMVMGDVGQIIPMRWTPHNEYTIYDICSRSNVVVNCVGRDYKPLIDDNWEFSNVKVAELIAKACAETYVDRLIHVSALGASLEHPSQLLRLKAIAEEKVKEKFPEVTIVRPSFTYGTLDKFINFIARRLSPMDPFGVPIVRRGQAKVQPVYVGNVADGIVALLALSNTDGKVYEFGGPKVMQFNELVNFVANSIGRQYTVFPVAGPFAKPFFTTDRAEQMKYDHVVNEDAFTFKDLGIEPLPIEEASNDVIRKFSVPKSRLIRDKFNYY